MKSKKILLGVLMALAIGTSAFNLFGADGHEEVPDLNYKWRKNGCHCQLDQTPDYSKYQYYGTEELCIQSIPDDCNEN